MSDSGTVNDILAKLDIENKIKEGAENLLQVRKEWRSAHDCGIMRCRGVRMRSNVGIRYSQVKRWKGSLQAAGRVSVGRCQREDSTSSAAIAGAWVYPYVILVY